MSDLQFSDYRIDRSRRQLRRGEEALPLPAKAFDLLAYMAANPGRLLPKSELLSAVWPDSFVEESNLTQNVFILRRILKSGAEGAILTVPGRGYQFTTEVAEVPHVELLRRPSQEAAPGLLLDATHARIVYEEEVEDRISIRKSPLGLTLLIATLLVTGLAAWLGWLRYEDRVGGPPVQVVVADFDGSTGDPVLDRTLKDVLRFNLGQSPFVNVVPLSTVRAVMALMRNGPADTLTPEVARDLCERTASQAVLRGHLAHPGSRYVVTEEAINCVDGAVLGAAKQEVARSDDLPGAMDRIGASLRHDLGESRRTIARFNKPLFPQHTGSLEALKDFSQANYVSQSGRFPESIELLKQAVALDPQFAAAYFNLAAFYSNILDPVDSRAYLQKAYDTRDFATEPTRLTIVANYHNVITGDLYESLRNYQTWIDMYPCSALAWNGQANVLGDLGRFPEAMESAKRHLELLPDYVTAYISLASLQMNNEHYMDARRTCDIAISHGFENERVHELYLSLGHATHDPDLVAAQERWGDEHPDSPTLMAYEAAFAVSEGRIADAQKLLDRMDDAFRRQGTPDAGIRLRQMSARAFVELGDLALARKQLDLGPVDPNDLDHLIALAETGQPDMAAAMLRDQLAGHPQSTLWNQRYAPQFRARMALLAHKPADALAQLEPLTRSDGPDVDTFYDLGEAYMQAGRLPQAEDEFRTLLTHRGLDPPAFQFPLAQLNLARVLAMQGRRAEAMDAYRTLLQAWSHADANLLPLQQAKSELSALQGRA